MPIARNRSFDILYAARGAGAALILFNHSSASNLSWSDRFLIMGGAVAQGSRSTIKNFPRDRGCGGRCTPSEWLRVIRRRNRLIARHDAHSARNEEISA